MISPRTTDFIHHMNTTQYILTSHYLLGNDMSLTGCREILWGLTYRKTCIFLCSHFQGEKTLTWYLGLVGYIFSSRSGQR